MTGRWCECPARLKDISMHITLRERVRRYFMKKKETPDVYMVTGYRRY